LKVERPLTQESTAGAEPPEEDSVQAAFARLYADGRAYATAEIGRQKLRAGIVSAGVRDAAIMAVGGLVLAFAGLIAFLVGLVLLLTPHLGAGWAACLVFGCSLGVALLLLLMAKARFSSMKKAVGS
jgi:hypothetical protein